MMDKFYLSSFEFTHLPSPRFTINLGDDIQTECAARLWNVRQYVERDDFKTWTPDMRIPFFGWYGYDLTVPPKADCVLISFHLCVDMMMYINKNPIFKDWFCHCVKQQGFPAMARDIATMNFMRQLGVECEFGGCLTQTLKPYDGERSGIFGIDAPKEISSQCDFNISQLNNGLYNMPHEDRLKLASKRIELYCSASHIHTSRIHTYLPCKALNTPVTFYKHNIFEPHRLSGLVD
jgi:hypothetical protein